ncbi:hypothetical protein Golax_024891, partial [Gossypium laxum]|nr:hypothetical protein [Gossypium laxum]
HGPFITPKPGGIFRFFDDHKIRAPPPITPWSNPGRNFGRPIVRSIHPCLQRPSFLGRRLQILRIKNHISMRGRRTNWVRHHSSNKCKPAWWQSLIGWKSMDLTERERCEDIEMEACLVAAKEKCVGFAKVKCTTPFLDARIAVGEKEIMNKRVERMVHAASLQEESKWAYFIGSDNLGGSKPRVTNSRASQ